MNHPSIPISCYFPIATLALTNTQMQSRVVDVTYSGTFLLSRYALQRGLLVVVMSRRHSRRTHQSNQVLLQSLITDWQLFLAWDHIFESVHSIQLIGLS